MRHLFIYFVLFVLTSNISFAQNVKFSAGVGVGSVPEYEDVYTTPFEGQSYMFISDSLLQVSEVTRVQTVTTTYKSKRQFSVYGTIDFQLGSHFELSTGLGFSFHPFDFKLRQVGRVLTEVIMDTIALDDFLVQRPQVGCDSSVYLPQGVVKQGRTDFGLLDLQVPLTVKYELFEGFKLNVGGQLNTPIYTGQNGSRTETRRFVEDGKTICLSTPKGYRDHSGKGFRQMRLSILGGVSYRVNDRLEVNGLASKSLQSVFVDVEPKAYSQKGDYKPISLRLGVSYLFGQSKEQNRIAN